MYSRLLDDYEQIYPILRTGKISEYTIKNSGIKQASNGDKISQKKFYIETMIDCRPIFTCERSD